MGWFLSMIIGIDEVGRGCLAGPVYMAGVALDATLPKFTFSYDSTQTFAGWDDLKSVRDSKKLNSAQRELVANLVQKYALKSVWVGASNRLIDEFGIGVCLTHLLVLVCRLIESQVGETKSENVEIVVDGKIKLLPILKLDLLVKLWTENQLNLDFDKYFHPQNLVQLYGKMIRENKADDKYLSVALASNLAKVQRDKLMGQLDLVYPIYNWKQNKGYGTLAHRQTIALYPNNPYLRKSFLGKLVEGLSVI
jgi:ribonuclease HII